MWIKVISEPANQDWIHTYEVFNHEITRTLEEEEDFVDILCFDLDFNNSDQYYLVYRFYENYIDHEYIFTNLDEATRCFYENIKNQTIYPEEYQVIEKNHDHELVSTIYEKNYDNKYIWPDKSNRWVLVNLNNIS